MEKKNERAESHSLSLVHDDESDSYTSEEMATFVVEKRILEKSVEEELYSAALLFTLIRSEKLEIAEIINDLLINQFRQFEDAKFTPEDVIKYMMLVACKTHNITLCRLSNSLEFEVLSAEEVDEELSSLAWRNMQYGLSINLKKYIFTVHSLLTGSFGIFVQQLQNGGGVMLYENPPTKDSSERTRNDRCRIFVYSFCSVLYKPIFLPAFKNKRSIRSFKSSLQ